MRTHDLSPRHSGGLRALRSLTLAALASALLPLTGCTIIVGDHVGGHGGEDDFDAIEACYDDHEECLEDADGNALFIDACSEALDACLEPYGGRDGAGDSAGASAGDSAGDGAGDSAGDGAGDSAGDTAGDSAGDEVPAICIDLHINCLANAATLLEVEACEGLFEHCAHPAACEGDCPNKCPDPELGACLDDYAGCVGAAATEAEVDACTDGFNGCVADIGGSECLPDVDPEHLDECLAEHELCTACAADDEQLIACKEVFDVCVHPPV